jgi:formamidopyrimidine-DNA glycosylase
MSGRVLVDDQEAGDPLIYASNLRTPRWHRFGVHFKDGGDFMLRDPRRLGAVVLLDRALGRRTAPIKAVLMDQQRIAGIGNLLADEILWRAGIDPMRTPERIDADERAALAKTIRATLRQLDRRGGSHTGDMPRDEGVPCPKDGAPLRRRTVGGRTTFDCPQHQR